MSPLEDLAPDQRAVVTLVLQQGRSYEDIAAMLGIPPTAVRARAHAGLKALAPDSSLPDEVTGPLVDYLLGQQSPADAAATRALLGESAPLRGWAGGVARWLEALAPGALPEVPDGGGAAAGAGTRDLRAGGAPSAAPGGEAPAPPASADAPYATPSGAPAAAPLAAAGMAAGAAASGRDAPTAPLPPTAPGPARGGLPPTPPATSRPAGGAPPHEPAAPPSSGIGGMVLIGGVLAVVAIVVVIVVRGGSGGEEPAATAVAPSATATPAATGSPAQITDRIPLRGVAGSRATGRMTVFVQNKRLVFQLRARNVPPNGSRSAYAVWFTGPGSRARRLGYTNPVGADGRLGIQGPSDPDVEVFPRLYSTYLYVVVSRETERNAPRPGDPVLRGLLPAGR